MPRSASVKVGETVTWVNSSRIPHDVVATSGASFESDVFAPGMTFSFSPMRPGAISYVCTLHQGMSGTLVVRR